MVILIRKCALSILVLLFCGCYANPYQKNPTESDQIYKKFLMKYPRDFSIDTLGYTKRLKIFTENIKLIEQMNNENGSAQYDITKFTDWTDDEFDQCNGKLETEKRSRMVRGLERSSWQRVRWDGSYYAPQWDWRNYRAVTEVKQQDMKCNSCYAYAVAAVVESLYALKYKRHISISEYEMLDCDFTNQGCESGTTRRSMARGIYSGFTRTSNYPQMYANPYYCPKRGEFFIDKLYAIDPDANSIAWFIYTNAPVALNFAIPKGYKFYKSGVLPDSYECWEMEPNHAAAAVGYGVENGKKYWLLKNSWGPWWGDHGYMKMERGINACQVETHAMSAGI